MTALILTLSLTVLVVPAQESVPPAHVAGAAKIDITPEHPILLAGYGHRTIEHEGVDDRLWARALVIGAEDPVLLIAVDNAGVPATLVAKVAAALLSDGVRREHLAVSSTHTHTAPNLVGFAPVMWDERMTVEEEAHVHRYTAWLTERLIEVARTALKNRRPAHLAWAQGSVTFGGNRRVIEDGTWRGFGFATDGPVDHSLPVLVARDASDTPIAIWTSFACHCTTVGGRNHIGGDWAGAANRLIEEQHPRAIALLTIGCGADVGPQPSGSLEIARQHGRRIADEVARLIEGPLHLLTRPPVAQYHELSLPLSELPDRAHWESEAERDDFRGVLARRQLATLERGDSLPSTVEYPFSVWSFGNELAIVFLAGEVVVDYSVRLKSELDWRRLWINAYTHDVPCYIPSRRVLNEDGYEPDFSMVYYGWPTRFDPSVEDQIVRAVIERVGPRFQPSEAPPVELFHHPLSAARFPDRLRTRLGGEIPHEVRRAVERIQRWSTVSRSGFGRLVRNEGEEGEWLDFAGAMRRRPFLRQVEAGRTLEWETGPASEAADKSGRVFVFLGGLGWESEPETEGFSLHLDGTEQLRFDLARSPRTWRSADRRVQLHYFPTWTSDLDSGGLFHLIVAGELLEPGKPCRLTVRSEGSGSRRWFAVDTIEDPKAIEQMLVDAAD